TERGKWIGGAARQSHVLAAGAIALVLLGIQLSADPATGVTYSHSPFTDEGWSLLGARNFVLLGRWATDAWQLYVTQLPFSIVNALGFMLFGVGIIQARVVSMLCTVGAVLLVSWLVGRRCGAVPGLVAGVALGTTSLLLYYGRLAILEPMVVLFLTGSAAALLAGRRERWVRHGILAGALAALAIGTKPSAAAPFVGILLGVLVVAPRGEPGMWRRTAIACLVPAVLGTFWLTTVNLQAGLLDSIIRTWPDQFGGATAAEMMANLRAYPIGSDAAIPMTAPLLAAGGLGLLAAGARWRLLNLRQRQLVGASVGWFVVGMAVLLVVPYRPNRYVLPMLPPLAMLAGVGSMVLLDLVRRSARVNPWLQRGAIAVLVAAIAIPGVGRLAGWTARATHRLPQIQEEVLRLVTDGRAMQGGPAPNMGMRVPVPAIIVQREANDGDLYEEFGVRWVFGNRTTEPAWAGAHRQAWQERELMVCYPWPSGEACLYRLP
ncbi:MAG: glycosyltransferase family 39 protein, partial [Chloroflexota bacterium]